MGELWPVHYKPLPDELLSCWLVRLAHGHALKSQTFCNIIFGNGLQVWNRDIDRLAPPWLLEVLSHRTATSPEMALSTTLRTYEGMLYRKFRLTGALPWILTLKMYHRKRQGHGLQFCPACLEEDLIPYFRRCWRVAFNTVCAKHGTRLHDRCPRCGVAIAVHRIDMGKINIVEAGLSLCYTCGFDLRNTQSVEPISYDRQASELLMAACQQLDIADASLRKWDLGRYAVMHQLCKILLARNVHVHLRTFVLDLVGFQDMKITDGRMPFEMRSIEERHHLVQLAAWLLVDAESRLTAAWKGKAVRYNVLLKDFNERPDWFSQIVTKFSNWRTFSDPAIALR